MKNWRFIFVFIFLAGMVFTVIQYLPILEEETPGHRVEMAKKNQKGEMPEGGDGTDDDNNDSEDEKTDLYYYHSGGYFSHLEPDHNFHITHKRYCYPIASIHTPPPKL